MSAIGKAAGKAATRLRGELANRWPRRVRGFVGASTGTRRMFIRNCIS
jgi:hypothetical protein